jgi:8-oxo-dGTP diphosphatase
MSSDRLYPTRPILAASVAVFREKRVLVGRRTKPPALHLYALPGGEVELGETIEEAALRELWEETKIKADLIGLAGFNNILTRDKEGRVDCHFIIACFAARWIEGEGSSSGELDDVRWAGHEDIKSLPLAHGVENFIEKARALL